MGHEHVLQSKVNEENEKGTKFKRKIKKREEECIAY